MKKILISLTLLSLISCGEDTVKISKGEYQRLKGDTVSPKYPKPFSLNMTGISYSKPDGIVLGSDGHEYLVINANSNSMNVEHYIDCEKCKQREIKK